MNRTTAEKILREDLKALEVRVRHADTWATTLPYAEAIGVDRRMQWACAVVRKNGRVVFPSMTFKTIRELVQCYIDRGLGRSR